MSRLLHYEPVCLFHLLTFMMIVGGHPDQQTLFRFENFKFYAKEDNEVTVLFR